MMSTVSDLIKNKTEHLQKSIGSPGAENQNLAAQAAALVEQDEQNLPRLGTKFRIPNENELPAHLQNLDFDSFLAEQLLRESSLLLDRCLQQQVGSSDSTKKISTMRGLFECVASPSRSTVGMRLEAGIFR